MKSIALILLLLFAGTIVTPFAESLCKKNKVTLFIVDEEKGGNNPIPEVKESKKFTTQSSLLACITFVVAQSTKANPFSKSTLPAHPVLEFLTPPPNFC